MKILIADDANVMHKVIRRELIEMGFESADIFYACDGKEALAKVRESEFDLILMDWNMPNMLGIDALIVLRSIGIETPVMMITTESERSNIIKAIQAGATNYLTKPFNREDFRSKINSILGDQLFIESNTSVENIKAPIIDLAKSRVTLQSSD